MSVTHDLAAIKAIRDSITLFSGILAELETAKATENYNKVGLLFSMKVAVLDNNPELAYINKSREKCALCDVAINNMLINRSDTGGYPEGVIDYGRCIFCPMFKDWATNKIGESSPTCYARSAVHPPHYIQLNDYLFEIKLRYLHITAWPKIDDAIASCRALIANFDQVLEKQVGQE